MLSSTSTITDIKSKLENTHDFYGFATDVAFTASLTSVIDDVYLRYFLTKIGATEYTRIATKDKVALTQQETYLYWAEVYMTCCLFLKRRAAVQGQLQNSGQETLRVEGYQHSVGGGGGISQGSKAVQFYFDQAFSMFKHAGINVLALERTCTIFGDGINVTNVIS